MATVSKAKKVTTTVNGVPHTTTVKSGSSSGSSSSSSKANSNGFVNGRDTIRSDADNAKRLANNIRPATDDEPTLDQPAGIDKATQPEGLQPVSPDKTGQLAYSDALKNLNSGGLSGTALTNAQKSLAGAYGQAPSTPFTQAHQQLQASGVAPSDGGAAMSAVSSAKPYTPDQTAVDQVFSQDPVINNLMSSAWDMLSPDNTKGSLMGDYKKLRKDSGLDEINEEMIDAETIINGTEDDIRNEIQTAGGFGTDSQIQSMALARNKNLLKRYNSLAQMQTNATNQLNTMLNLDAQDRQMAQQRVSAQVSALFNFANFRQQAQNNIREGFNSLVAKVGYSGAYAAYASHPDQLAQIEGVMGLAPGGLSQLASQPDYDMLLKQAQLESSRASTAASYSSIAKNNAEIQNTTATKQNAIKANASSVDETLSAVNTALKQVNPLSSGLIGGTTSFIPSTPSKNLSSTIKTIQGALSLDQLAQLKANSPNGASGLGSASEKEGEWLSSRVANLDVGQSTEQLKSNLQTIQTHYINYLQTLGYGYDQRTGTVIAP